MERTQRSFIGIQVLSWLLFYLFLLVYAFNKWASPWLCIGNTTISVFLYIITIYGNSHWLFPRYSGKRYILYSVLFLSVLILLRMFMEDQLLNVPLGHAFYGWTSGHLAFSCITILLAYLFGALFRVTLNYVLLLRHQETLRHQQLAAELNLLKAQVQPHFLFNSLNNIYYLAYKKSDDTPGMIAKLAGLMRYFVDEAPKEKVPLQTEIKFIQNYIELEQIRMLHALKIDLLVKADLGVMVPPMLLIPLVENIFKHGVDKMRSDNEARIELEVSGEYLNFRVSNRMALPAATPGGLGLANLRKRLSFLYNGSSELDIKEEKDQFMANLRIPII